jgi:hypothetical protein
MTATAEENLNLQLSGASVLNSRQVLGYLAYLGIDVGEEKWESGNLRRVNMIVIIVTVINPHPIYSA